MQQYQQKQTEGRKRKLRTLTQETKDLMKLKQEQYLEKSTGFLCYITQIILVQLLTYPWQKKFSILTNNYNNKTATTPNKKAELLMNYLFPCFLRSRRLGT